MTDERLRERIREELRLELCVDGRDLIGAIARVVSTREQAAREEERAACAKVCAVLRDSYERQAPAGEPHPYWERAAGADDCEEAIRHLPAYGPIAIRKGPQ